MATVEGIYDDIRWTKYELRDGRDVYLTQRPDRANLKSVFEFIEDKDPSVRFCFTDDYVNFTSTVTPWQWLPWLPQTDIPIENVFAFIAMMTRARGNVWLHCDSSTMRAPTYFGLYLYAHHTESEVQQIVDGKTTSPGFDKVYAEFSCAKKYADICFSMQPEIKSLIATWQGYGEVAAHEVLMKYRRDK